MAHLATIQSPGTLHQIIIGEASKAVAFLINAGTEVISKHGYKPVVWLYVLQIGLIVTES